MDRHSADQRTINFAAIEKFQRTHRWVSEVTLFGKRYDWWKRPDGTLVLIGPVT